MGRDAATVILVLGLALGTAVLYGLARQGEEPSALAQAGHAAGLQGRAEGATTPSGQPPAVQLYVVKRGDTLYGIASRFGTTVAVLQRLNDLDDPDRIGAGQVLRVPAGAGEAAGVVPTLGAVARPSPGRYGAVSDWERHLLASLIWHEARGEPFEGQIAVGAVVLNRVDDPRFPDSILGVVTQPGQFPFSLEQLQRTRPDAWAYAAADRALAGEDPTGGALYFYNPAKTTTPEFWATRPVVARIGQHVFTR